MKWTQIGIAATIALILYFLGYWTGCSKNECNCVPTVVISKIDTFWKTLTIHDLPQPIITHTSTGQAENKQQTEPIHLVLKGDKYFTPILQHVLIQPESTDTTIYTYNDSLKVNDKTNKHLFTMNYSIKSYGLLNSAKFGFTDFTIDCPPSPINKQRVELWNLNSYNLTNHVGNIGLAASYKRILVGYSFSTEKEHTISIGVKLTK